MPVSDQHPEYSRSLPKWQLVDDCVEGSQAVKTRLDGKAYLPMPNPGDTSTENQSRYKAYLTRANFVNFTGHTKKGMNGMVFRRDSVIELPTQIDYLDDNANGGGLSLNQLVKEILGGTLETGRYGLLVDYPEAGENLTKADVDAMMLRANILPYSAESVINWRTTIIGAVKRLSLVVLQEKHENISTDGFSSDVVTYHRVLQLIDGVYSQTLFDDSDSIISYSEPRKSDGSHWDEIPFIFVGAENNDETVDDAPLYDLAEINLAHYRNSADYEESSFIVGQPTPILSGLTQGWVDEVLKGTVQLGSRAAIPLPEGGDGKLLQADPNQMPLEGMREKESQMLKVGARMIQDNAGLETAEAAKIRFAGQNSQLADIVGNIESALMDCFGWASEYMGGGEGYELEINKEFYDKSLDAQQIMAMIQLADRGDISRADMRSSLRKAGILDEARTDEDIDLEIDDDGAGLQLTDELGNEPAVNPQLIEILNKLTEKPNQQFIPAGTDSNGDTGGITQPNITIESPVFNIEIPEGMINVTVEAPDITVEAPDITVESPAISSPVNVVNGQTDKNAEFQYNEQGAIIGAALRVVDNE